MGISTALAVVGTIATVGGTAYSITSASKAADLQRRQQLAAEKRSRRQAIRSAQISRATALAATQGATGTLSGSGILGGVAAQGSNLGATMQYARNQSALSSRIGAAQEAQSLGSGIASFGSFLMGNASAIGGMFGPKQTANAMDGFER